MYYDHMDGGSGSGWIVMLIIMMLLIALAAVAVWYFVANARPQTGGGAPVPSARPSATDLLDERLARGEISPDEYRERMTALRERDQAG
jgi:putative membrane protein